MRSTASWTVRIVGDHPRVEGARPGVGQQDLRLEGQAMQGVGHPAIEHLGAAVLDLELVERADQLGRPGRGDGDAAAQARQERLFVPVEADVPPEDLESPRVGDDAGPIGRAGAGSATEPGSVAGPGSPGLTAGLSSSVVLDPRDLLAFAAARRGRVSGSTSIGQDVVDRDGVTDGPGAAGAGLDSDSHLPFRQVVGVRGDLLEALQRPAPGLDLDDLLPVLLGLDAPGSAAARNNPGSRGSPPSRPGPRPGRATGPAGRG